jgi:phenylacetate-CoA ligase
MRREEEDPCTFTHDKLFISPYHFNEKWINTIYHSINTFKGQFIHAYPSCFEYLADYMTEGLELERVKGIFLGSERITERQLELARQVCPDAPVIFWYGLSERTNLAWGQYINGHIQYRFDPVYGYTEAYIDESGRSEIVGTSYWNDVMPLIRYRTQDFAQIENGIMNQLEGREQEFLITKQGTKIPGFTIVIDKFTWDYVEIFQVVQNEKGKVEFHLKPKKSYTEEVGMRILSSQIAKWGSYFDLKIVTVNKIYKTSLGKTPLIVSNLQK